MSRGCVADADRSYFKEPALAPRGSALSDASTDVPRTRWCFMPLLGKAAMLLHFDIDAPAITEHDDWHTHAHLPERLSIPGFLRATRWVAVRGSPRYAILYEVEGLETLRSEAYLDRLNHPSPWTSKMMPHYRSMSRGLCSVEGSWGRGLGHFTLLVRFKHAAGFNPALQASRTEHLLPSLPWRPGLTSVHLLKGALAAAMTAEQRIRGADSGVDWALLATGYELDAVARLDDAELGAPALQAHGMSSVSSALYQAV